MVYVLLAEGFEEVEALTPVDLLRRAGAKVKTVGVTGKTVTGARGIPVVADLLPEEVSFADAEMVVLPGGMPGTKNLDKSEFVQKAIDYCLEKEIYLAAICAAPSIILGSRGLLKGKRATCYPGMEDGMVGAQAMAVPCVADGKIITGRAAGAAMDFAVALCAAVCGGAAAEKVARDVCHAIG